MPSSHTLIFYTPWACLKIWQKIFLMAEIFKRHYVGRTITEHRNLIGNLMEH